MFTVVGEQPQASMAVYCEWAALPQFPLLLHHAVDLA